MVACPKTDYVMAKSDSYCDFVVDQLADLGELDVRRMFGGFGIYGNAIFFAIVYDAVLYFKTDDSTRPEYVRRGMGPFRPNRKQTLKSYYQVPVELIEDDEALCQWARKALACQRAK